MTHLGLFGDLVGRSRGGNSITPFWKDEALLSRTNFWSVRMMGSGLACTYSGLQTIRPREGRPFVGIP